MDLALCWQLLWRSALILAAGEVLRRLQAGRSAAFRHRLVLLSFILLAFLPIFSALLPEIPLSLAMATNKKASVTIRQTAFVAETQDRAGAKNWIRLIWLAGVLIAFTPVTVGAISSKRIASRARRPKDAGWDELLTEPFLGQT
jgi:beta-lactamase regulating signal transducer with metallopeptidase domain